MVTPVANVAAIPATPSDDLRIKVQDATGIESFTLMAFRQALYDSGVFVNIIYQSELSSWVTVSYAANSPDER